MAHKQPSEIIASLQSGAITSEAITHSFWQLNERNTHLNALCVPLKESSLDKAKQNDSIFKNSGPIGPLHGLPITIKECFDYLNTPSTFGVTYRILDFPDTNDIYVNALENAGAVILGKTNVSQLLAFVETENPVYGTTLHPSNPLYSCGGSSGGEGALIGAGLSPLGLGTDIGGSVRVPAAVNGACGIKPTSARTPDKTRYIPDLDKIAIQSVVGPISQDALTLHTALEVLNESAKQHWPVEPLCDYRHIDITKLNIGYFVDDGIFPASPWVQAGIKKAVEQCRKLGANIIEYRFPDLQRAEALFYSGMSVENAKPLFDALYNDKPVENLKLLHRVAPLPRWLKLTLANLMALFGQKHQSRILPSFGRCSLSDTDKLKKAINEYTEQVVQSMANTKIGQLDAVLSPILPVPAYLQNSFKNMGLGGTYSLINNVTGFPAGIACVGVAGQPMPDSPYSKVDLAERTASRCEQQAEGLPLAVQITAPHWREDTVLALINALHVPNTQSLI